MSWLNQVQNKIVASDKIASVLADLRKIGGSVVFTNGCFDILHKGHVEYLAKTADLAEYLVVGINSDASVKRQGKEGDRPVNQLEARMTLIAALEFVDFVVAFDDDTPIDLIQKIEPDVLAKGADYNPDETDPNSKQYIVGREVVLSKGGKVAVIDLTPGFSTTGIIQKLNK